MVVERAVVWKLLPVENASEAMMGVKTLRDVSFRGTHSVGLSVWITQEIDVVVQTPDKPGFEDEEGYP